MRVRMGMAMALLLTVLGSVALAQPTVQQLVDRIEALEANVRIQRRTIKSLEGRSSNMDMSEALDKKIAALRDEMRAEMAAAGGGGPLDFRVYWKNGIRMDSADKSVKLKIGGRLMYDMAMFCDGSQDPSDGAEVRRARIYFSGTLGKHCGFKLQFDFAGGDATLKDAYVQFKKVLGLDSITVGHFNQPFTFEEPSSSKYLTFMERALPIEAFSHGRDYGIKLAKTLADKKLLIELGVFGKAGDYGDWSHENDNYNYAVRLVGVPFYADKGKKLLHLGASWTCEVNNGDARFRSRPEAHLSGRLVDTGSFAAEHTMRWGLEVLAIYNSLSFQAEYIGVSVDTPSGQTANFCGFYAYASWFITSEHRRYKLGAGTTSRVKVLNPFCNGKGTGAWEIAARYSSVDLNDADAGISGGRLSDITVGVNWYLNDNMRIMLNYVCASEDDTENTHILQWRAQVDF